MWGDNLRVLKARPTLGASLLYADPPFFSGKRRVSTSGSYADEWPSFETYLAWLMQRLQAGIAHLRPGGALWVHLDHHAVHDVKVRLDGVLGREAFRNEVIWCYNGGGVPAADFPRKHDTLLRYVTPGPVTFHTLRRPYKENTQSVGRHSTYARQVAIDLERGTPVTDWWADIPTVTGWNPERTGFPTQKPLALLRRIIESGTDPGDLVMDIFCGSGTTAVAARQLGRRFYGIDEAEQAISVARRRLEGGAHP